MKKKKAKRIFFTILTVSIIGVIIGGWYAHKVVLSPNFKVDDNKKQCIYVYPNDNIDKLVAQMESENVTINPDYVRLTARILKMDKHKLKAGCYKISDNESSWSVMQRIRRGEQTPVKLTINNVRTAGQFASKVSKQLMMDSASVMNFVTDTARMKELGFASHELFVLVVSNTYEMWWTISTDALMKRLAAEHDKFWQRNERDKRAQIIGLTRAEVVTLASIVDEETAKAGEQRRIAGLYLNRLHCGMLLQSDPTVKYATGDFMLTQILYSHLAIDSPYNTYRYAGLPPGPIRLPNTATIDAVLDAEQHNYLYMCADASMNGTHKFATTLSQHNINAQQYHAALRRWKASRK